MKKTSAAKRATILIGAHFPYIVHSALLAVQAIVQDDLPIKTTRKQLLGEAINDLCLKYNVPAPYVDAPATA